MTSAVNTEHLCSTLTVIREYSFVYAQDNHKVYISAFNLRVRRKIKDQITSRVQKKQHVTNTGLFGGIFFSVL